MMVASNYKTGMVHFDEWLCQHNLKTKKAKNKLAQVSNKIQSSGTVRNEQEYQNIMLYNLRIELRARLKAHVKSYAHYHNIQNDLLAATIAVERVSAQHPNDASSATLLIHQQNNSLIHCTDYLILFWKHSPQSAKQMLVVKMDKQDRSSAIQNKIRVIIPSIQRPILDCIVSQNGDKAIVIPAVDLSPYRRKFYAICHIHSVRLRSFLMGPEYLNQNVRDTDLWRYIGHTKGAYFYRKYLNEMQLAAIRYTLTQSLTIIKGGPGTGKTKAVLLPILKCCFNSLDIMYEVFNKKLLSIAISLKHHKDNAIKYVIEYWKTPRIGVFASSQHALSEIINTILNVNKIKYFCSFQRYSEIPIQRIGNETIDCVDGILRFEHMVIPKQSQNICHVIHNYLLCKFEKNGKINSDYEYLEALKKKKKVTRHSVKHQLFDKLMKLPVNGSTISNKMYRDIAYLIKQIRILKTEIICLCIIQNRNNYQEAMQKCVEVLMNQSKVIFAVPDTIGMFDCVKDFDYGLFDESNGMTEAETIIALRYCKRASLFGDLHGLKPKVFQSERDVTRSLFWRLNKYVPPIILDEQYRMHPEVALYPAKSTYNGKLSDCLQIELGSNSKQFQTDFSPFLFFDVQGVVLGIDDSYINQRECNQIKQLLSKLMKNEEYMKEIKNIGIITPYKAQKLLIKKQFGKEFEFMKEQYKIEVTCGDVYDFQGSQRDIIIISCVCNDSAQISDTLSDSSCVNVMLTRCKYALWVFGNSKCLSASSKIWSGLIENAKKRECFVE